MSYLQKLNDASDLSLQEFSAVGNTTDLETLRVKFLGRSGIIKDLQKEFAALPSDDKKKFGSLFNTAKTAIEANWKTAETRLSTTTVVDPPIDLTAPIMASIRLSNGAVIESPNPNNIIPFLKADYIKTCKQLKAMNGLFQSKCNELAETEDELTKVEEVLTNTKEQLVNTEESLVAALYTIRMLLANVSETEVLKDTIKTLQAQAQDRYKKDHPKPLNKHRDKYLRKFPSFHE